MVDTAVVRMMFSAIVNKREITRDYYAKQLGRDFWFIFPQDVYCSGWTQVYSDYFRFYINPEMQANFSRSGAEALDLFVERIAAATGISDERLKLLEQQKLDYYLCESDAELNKITRVPGTSYFDPCSDAIFSIDFPDFNPVSKFLINFRQQNLNLFSIPLLTEGFSIYLGGRWQRSPAVITDFGEYILNNDLTELDSVLIIRDTNGATMADITYPVDALFMDYLIDKLGMDKFWQLHRALSGDAVFKDTVSTEYVKGIITASIGLDWNNLLTAFNDFLDYRPARGGIIHPGQVINEDIILAHRELMLYQSDDWFQVKFFVPDSMEKSFHYLFGKDDFLKDKRSVLFNEQYKGEIDFEGYRYGLMIDRNEIGLYDYAANLLLAKYVYSFDPDPKYYDDEKKVITAYFNLNVFNGKIPNVEDGKVL